MSDPVMAARVRCWAAPVIRVGVMYVGMLAGALGVHAQTVPIPAVIAAAASIEGVSTTTISSAAILSDRLFTPDASSTRAPSQLASIATALVGMLAALFAAATFACLVLPRAVRKMRSHVR